MSRIHRNQPQVSMPVTAIHEISAAYRRGDRIEAKPAHRPGSWGPVTRWNFVAYMYRVANHGN